MIKNYAVYLSGVLVSTHLTRMGALSAVGKYVTVQKWDGAKLEVRELHSGQNCRGN